MSDADLLLEGLDPEQREVARRSTARSACSPEPAPARPGRSRTGSRTASPRGVMVPQEVLAVTFTTRAAGELRQRLARLGAAGVQARTFHSAALRQARYFWPQVYGGELPELVSSKLPLLAEATSRNRLKASQSDLRDLASEVEWAKVSNVRPDDYARVAAGRGRAVEGYDAGDRGEGLRRLRGGQARPQPDGHGGRAAVRRRRARRRRAGRVGGPPAVPVVRRRRVPGRQPAAVPAAPALARRPRRVCVVGDPAQTIYTFAGASADHLLDFPRVFPGTTSVTLHRNYRSTPEVIEAANTVMASQLGSSAVQLRATRQTGATVELTRLHRRGRRGRRGRRQDRRAGPGRREPGRHRGAVPDQRPVRQRRGGAGRAWRAVRRARRRAVLPAARGAAGGDAAARRRPGRGRGHRRGDRPTWSPTLTTMGWSAEPPDRPRQRPRSLGVAARAGLRRRGVRGGQPGAHAGRLRRGPAAPGRPAGGADRRRRHARHPARGQGARVAGRLRDRPARGHHAVRLRRHPGRGRRGAPADVRRRHPCPRRAAPVLVAGPQPRRPGDSAAEPVPRRARRASTAAPAPAPGARTRKRRNAVDDCLPGLLDGRSPTRASASSAAARTARARTTRSCSSRCAVAQGARGARTRCPAYCVFTDATMTALAEIKPRDDAELIRIPGIGKAKIDKYGDDILALVTGNQRRRRAAGRLDGV